MVNDTYNERQQETFITGMDKLEEACKAMHKKGFMECTPQQRHEFLVSLEKESKESNAKVMAEDKGKMEALQAENEKLPVAQRKEFIATPPHYYTLMKQLTLLGYFTSKIGATQALRHEAVPGRYDGEFPYKKGDKAWAE